MLNRATLPACLACDLFLAGGEARAARRLFVSSCHRDHDGSDGVERGLRPALEERCELRRFDSDGLPEISRPDPPGAPLRRAKKPL